MNKNEIISATCLLLSIAHSDNYFDKKEKVTIKEIIIDFFKIEKNVFNEIIADSIKRYNDATDLFEFGREINKTFNYQDKIDFICCAFEVAFSDKKLHYLEEHGIKKIANILNVKHNDLIKSKKEIKKYLK
ncbi:MAG: hypothetical protein CMG64_05045 [Candidatus Marinimicrobia bacterium]|nr:hypothetical protein [Candidatus Neomarinimicrobiota bacterium]|tara:strand:- start:6667 stop:7059 length:393 start_codon:yes stop_codon:yes gene_type:complete